MVTPMSDQVHDTGGPLGPLRSDRRLRRLLRDSVQYVNLMDHSDIDRLLASLSKLNGLTKQEMEEYLAEQEAARQAAAIQDDE